MRASPDDVWILVADVTRMGSWSPEATGAAWVGGADAPAVGAHFKGANRQGSKSWKTDCVVTACEPGELFGFDVKVGPFKVARWTYEFRPVAAGCEVTERWDDQRGWLIDEDLAAGHRCEGPRRPQPGDDERDPRSNRHRGGTALTRSATRALPPATGRNS